MARFTRRGAVQMAMASVAGSALSAPVAAAPSACGSVPRYGIGREGQRRADLGDGTYRNPIIAGDRPDPTILKDGRDYYLTCSSFTSYPGAVIWHSTDLVNWAPITAALRQPLGAVWAMDLVKHGGRYYLYIPVMQEKGSRIVVIHATDVRGPWSDPVDLDLPDCIDPGHAVGEDGKRYLFVNGVRRIQLTDDGLATVGTLEKVYEPWHYPKEWVVEMFAPEGPKIIRHGRWFYLLTAVGGTSGPPTSHMVTVARSASIHGPWENAPNNPVVRTRHADEAWWSRGHASLVEGPAGDWWMVYHGYENGMRTLGRQTLLEPVAWTADGWLKPLGGTLDRPLKKPRGGLAGPAGADLSDDFSTDRLGLQWSLFAPGPDDASRLKREAGRLTLQGKGTGLADCSPLTCLVGDRSYQASVSVEVEGDAQGGLALFYDGRGFVGIGLGQGQSRTYNYGQEIEWMRQATPQRLLHLRVTNRENIVTFETSLDGTQWTQHPWQMEVGGFHHNVFGGFLSLKLALFSVGRGAVHFRDFQYRGLR